MRFELVEQRRQSGNPQLALSPVPIVFVTVVLKLRHRHLPFPTSARFHVIKKPERPLDRADDALS
jgi:hypothetical protein